MAVDDVTVTHRNLQEHHEHLLPPLEALVSVKTVGDFLVNQVNSPHVVCVELDGTWLLDSPPVFWLTPGTHCLLHHLVVVDSSHKVDLFLVKPADVELETIPDDNLRLAFLELGGLDEWRYSLPVDS